MIQLYENFLICLVFLLVVPFEESMTFTNFIKLCMLCLCMSYGKICYLAIDNFLKNYRWVFLLGSFLTGVCAVSKLN